MKEEWLLPWAYAEHVHIGGWIYWIALTVYTKSPNLICKESVSNAVRIMWQRKVNKVWCREHENSGIRGTEPNKPICTIKSLSTLFGTRRSIISILLRYTFFFHSRADFFYSHLDFCFHFHSFPLSCSFFQFEESILWFSKSFFISLSHFKFFLYLFPSSFTLFHIHSFGLKIIPSL